MKIYRLATCVYTIPRKYAPNIDWSKLDWSKPTKELAHMLGVDRSTILKYRKAYAPHTVRLNQPVAPVAIEPDAEFYQDRAAEDKGHYGSK